MTPEYPVSYAFASPEAITAFEASLERYEGLKEAMAAGNMAGIKEILESGLPLSPMEISNMEGMSEDMTDYHVVTGRDWLTEHLTCLETIDYLAPHLMRRVGFSFDAFYFSRYDQPDKMSAYLKTAQERAESLPLLMENPRIDVFNRLFSLYEKEDLVMDNAYYCILLNNYKRPQYQLHAYQKVFAFAWETARENYRKHYDSSGLHEFFYCLINRNNQPDILEFLKREHLRMTGIPAVAQQLYLHHASHEAYHRLQTGVVHGTRMTPHNGGAGTHAQQKKIDHYHKAVHDYIEARPTAEAFDTLRRLGVAPQLYEAFAHKIQLESLPDLQHKSRKTKI